MQLNALKLLEDIRLGCEDISDFTKDVTSANDFIRNNLLHSAVERKLEIIGEATNKLLKNHPDIEINNARQIISLRNLIIHSYDNLDLFQIWAIIKTKLPELKKEVIDLINKFEKL
ncbi:MAG: DUF86 domain-containing protein [Bacteroidia bacterium]